MTQTERRIYLIEYMLGEDPRYADITVPDAENEQKNLLRALFNVRMPKAVTDEFLNIQDAYLQNEIAAMGITDYKDLTCISDDIYLWKGDITTLRCGAIVNAANSGMMGCFAPNHACIDNAIHTFAGIQLRSICGEIMEKQGYSEPTGKAKITPAYNLPCSYVLHTVGPIVEGKLNDNYRSLLASSYRECLKLADETGLDSVAFCCISTGVFRFPNEEAAEIAVRTVREYKKQTGSEIKIIFNVFKDLDYEIYKRILQ